MTFQTPYSHVTKISTWIQESFPHKFNVPFQRNKILFETAAAWLLSKFTVSCVVYLSKLEKARVHTCMIKEILQMFWSLLMFIVLQLCKKIYHWFSSSTTKNYDFDQKRIYCYCLIFFKYTNNIEIKKAH